MTLFAWVKSFTILKLRYGKTVSSVDIACRVKINKIVSKKITDDEKLTIATLNPLYSGLTISGGSFNFINLLKLLAQNVTSFTKPYIPTEYPRIARYLRTRSSKYKHLL
jgi:hypothetical protein